MFDEDCRTERLTKLRELVMPLPRELLAIDTFEKPHPVFGTRRCVFTHAAHDPWFQDQGFSYYLGAIRYRSYGHVDMGNDYTGEAACAQFFGIRWDEVDALMASDWVATKEDIIANLDRLIGGENPVPFPTK